MSQIYTIKKLATSGKWLEYWFEESPVKYKDELDINYHPTGNKVIDDSFDNCSKTYMFFELLEKAGISVDEDLNFYIGLKMTWDETDHPEKIVIPDEVKISNLENLIWRRKETALKNTWILTVKNLDYDKPNYNLTILADYGFCVDGDYSGNFTFDYWTYLPHAPSFK